MNKHDQLRDALKRDDTDEVVRLQTAIRRENRVVHFAGIVWDARLTQAENLVAKPRVR